MNQTPGGSCGDLLSIASLGLASAYEAEDELCGLVATVGSDATSL